MIFQKKRQRKFLSLKSRIFVLLDIIYCAIPLTNIEIVLSGTLRDFIETRNFSNTVASRQSNQLIRALDYNIDNI